jgi:hypothetical protein
MRPAYPAACACCPGVRFPRAARLYAGRAFSAPLTLEPASPAGLTVRARPEARPEMRAANIIAYQEDAEGLVELAHWL